MPPRIDEHALNMTSITSSLLKQYQGSKALVLLLCNIYFAFCFLMAIDTKVAIAKNAYKDSRKASECEKKGPADFDQEIIKVITESGAKGMLVALNAAPQMQGTKLQMLFKMKAGDQFSGRLMIGNFTDDEKRYTIICLVDYHQVSYIANGTAGIFHPVTVNSREKIILPFGIDGMAKGVHDVVFIAVQNMLESSNGYTDFPVLSYRATVIVDGAMPRVIKYKPFDSAPSVMRASEISLKECAPSGAHLAEDRETHDRNLARNVCAQISNSFSDANRFAAVFFKGFMQITPESDTKENEWFFLLQSGRTAHRVVTLPSTSNTPAEKIWAIIAPNPYMIPESPTRAGILGPMIIIFSNMVDID